MELFIVKNIYLVISILMEECHEIQMVEDPGV